MKITTKDIEQLNKSIDIFNFNTIIHSKHNAAQYRVNEDARFDKDLQNKILSFLEAKIQNQNVYYSDPSTLAYSRVIFPKLPFADLSQKIKEGVSIKLVTTPREWGLEFLSNFVGEDFSVLEKFFVNYAAESIPVYFRNRQLFALDSESRLLLSYFEGKGAKDISLQDFKINYFYSWHQKIFSDKSASEMQEIYERDLKLNTKYNAFSKFDSATARANKKINLFLHSLFSLIILKRPLKDMQNFLMSGQEELRDKTVLSFISKLDKKLMPEIVELIEHSINASQHFKNISIDFQEESREQKVFKIDMRQFMLKYQWKLTPTQQHLLNIFTHVAYELDITHKTLENSCEGHFFAILCLSTAEKLKLYGQIVLDIINNDTMVNYNGQQIREYTNLSVERYNLSQSIADSPVSSSYKI